MKRRTMAGNAALLSVFSIIAKVISALYRVPLTSVLGAEGMGMYQLVFSIYALILALTTGGIPVAVSRLTSENNALKKDSRVVLKNALFKRCRDVGRACRVLVRFVGVRGKNSRKRRREKRILRYCAGGCFRRCVVDVPRLVSGEQRRDSDGGIGAF